MKDRLIRFLAGLIVGPLVMAFCPLLVLGVWGYWVWTGRTPGKKAAPSLTSRDLEWEKSRPLPGEPN